MLWRDDETPTFHLASVVDDIDFGITHVIRGSDHRPNEELHAALHRALGHEPPTVIHHGLVVGDDGKKLSKRAEGATVAALRDAGFPPEAVRGYLEELGDRTHVDAAVEWLQQHATLLGPVAVEGLNNVLKGARGHGFPDRG